MACPLYVSGNYKLAKQVNSSLRQSRTRYVWALTLKNRQKTKTTGLSLRCSQKRKAFFFLLYATYFSKYIWLKKFLRRWHWLAEYANPAHLLLAQQTHGVVLTSMQRSDAISTSIRRQLDVGCTLGWHGFMLSSLKQLAFMKKGENFTELNISMVLPAQEKLGTPIYIYAF